MKKELFITMAFILSAHLVKAQKSDTTIYLCALKKDKSIPAVGAHDPFVYFDSCPQFPGGDEAFYKFLAKKLKWPIIDQDVRGTVFVNFVIEKNGKLTHITIDRGLTPALNAEALRVIRLSPDWIPAKVNNKPFRCRYTVPIRFIMND